MKKSYLLGVVCACMCSLSFSTSHANTVWSAALFDNNGEEWDLHVVTTATNLNDGSLITGLYLASYDILSTVEPADLLNTPVETVAENNNIQSDWVSTTINTMAFTAELNNQYTIDTLDVLGNQPVAVARPDAQQLSCVPALDHCTIDVISELFRTVSHGLQTQVLFYDKSLQEVRFSLSASAAVPLPAAVWLFGSGLLGLVGIARRKKAA
jgi:hypothetical protein